MLSNRGERCAVIAPDCAHLLPLPHRHSIGFRPADGGYLPHWGVRTLPELNSIARPDLDRTALPNDFEFEPDAIQQERLAAVLRDDQERRASRPQ
jgi:hypothetical protein